MRYRSFAVPDAGVRLAASSNERLVLSMSYFAASEINSIVVDRIWLFSDLLLVEKVRLNIPLLFF